MFCVVSCCVVCCLGIGLSDVLITHAEDSYWVCVWGSNWMLSRDLKMKLPGSEFFVAPQLKNKIETGTMHYPEPL